ncbi:DUF3618 domain-containing protein [Neorhizobium sp. T786]|uniref:DUF3618 domain-containing protein n=1 Tax=Pseudorhizobium xiangyangii TaxID=2883104 RepID=UPI001CFF8AAD|nr:DUF3618 domain-containing protein [Neorhizobium xiangyangii]MCB5203789.1 DUF3618 domain-containing protein [Neorhizobium xiangyangii]
MAYTSDNPRSAEIEREISDDRRRIEERLDAIQQRMSPGELVDEVLAYAKSTGGGEYASNLGAAVRNNPIPMALMGVSVAWMMAGSKARTSSALEKTEEEYPLAQIKGGLRRTGPVQIDGGRRYTHFSDGEGGRFKALTDETGRRAGHFIDESGKTFRGFADASGKQIHDIRDEAGKLFDDASGWVSKTWRDMTRSAGNAGMQVTSAGRSAIDVGSQLNNTILKHFKDQPLVGGALAFAVGAAIGAALPHTQVEDEALGEASDDLKSKVSNEVLKSVDKAEGVAFDIYGKATTVAADVLNTARDRVVEEASALKDESGTNLGRRS